MNVKNRNQKEEQGIIASLFVKHVQSNLLHTDLQDFAITLPDSKTALKGSLYENHIYAQFLIGNQNDVCQHKDYTATWSNPNEKPQFTRTTMSEKMFEKACTDKDPQGTLFLNKVRDFQKQANTVNAVQIAITPVTLPSLSQAQLAS